MGRIHLDFYEIVWMLEDERVVRKIQWGPTKVEKEGRDEKREEEGRERRKEKKGKKERERQGCFGFRGPASIV